MTTLFTTKYIYGTPKASDDICELIWKDINKINIENDIMPVHHKLIKLFVNYAYRNDLCNFSKDDLTRLEITSQNAHCQCEEPFRETGYSYCERCHKDVSNRRFEELTKD